MTQNSCPICNGLYHDIALSYWVCKRHLSWFVTICIDCKQPSFSDCTGVCPECAKLNGDEYYADYPTSKYAFNKR